MRVSLDLPDDISAALEERWRDIPRHAIEALAVEGYRTGALPENQVRRLLGFESRFDMHALLKEHRVPLRTQKRTPNVISLHIANWVSFANGDRRRR
jgi:hypothetical protein